METSKLINLFLSELDEEINELSSTLLQLEREPSNLNLIEDIYINIHTIKGSSTSLYNNIKKDGHIIEKPIQSISNLTHRFEDLVEILRTKPTISETYISFLFSFVSLIENLQNEIANEGEHNYQQNVNELIDSIFMTLNNSIGKQSNTYDSMVSKRLFFELTLSSDEELKHGYLSLVYRDIEERYHECVFSPSKEELLKGDDFSNIVIQLITTDEFSVAQDYLETLNNVASVENIPYHHNTPISTAYSVDELLENQKNASNNNFETTILSPIKKEKVKSIRIEPKRIDNVLKHTSKLVILKNKLNEFLHQNDFLAGTRKRKELEDIFDDITLHVDFLQESVLEIRMTPFEQLYSRFPKDVRTLSKEYNKPIEFQTIGSTTEIDKSILDDLYEPFMHLIRNSIIHGIETPEERAKKGKPPTGVISIHAKPDKNRVVINIIDDGKGIDFESLKQSALEKQILTSKDIDDFTKEEAYKLIFKTGVSSTKHVNQYSGRGVGMDAFRKKIEDLKGSFTIDSQKDVGTNITVYLPLTTAIIEGMITKINGEFFTFPISQVEEVINIKKDEIRSSSNRHFFFLRDKEVPIVYSNHFFNLGEELKNDLPFKKIMILRSQNQLVGFTIDEYLGQQSVVVKNMHPFIENASGISNCHVLGDGSISLIVDSSELLTKR